MAASAEFARVFSQDQVPSDIPEFALPAEAMKDGLIGVVALLVRAGLAASNGEARRLVEQGAVRVGEAKVTDPRALLSPAPGTVIRCGKRGFARVIQG
jgi:tyrosyl-tRNA synthetase